MYSVFLLVILSAIGGGYGTTCLTDSNCSGSFSGSYCCSNYQCCYFKDTSSFFAKSCTNMFDCSGDTPYCCSNKKCCSFLDSTTEAAQLATGVVVAICVVIALVIIGCCVGIVLCCRRQTNYGRVVRVPATATTTVHQTHTVVQPQMYPHGVQPQYPAAPNKDQPPPYCPPAYTPGAPAYPPMPQPAMNPSGVPYPTAAPPYPMAAQVQQNQLQASAPPMM